VRRAASEASPHEPGFSSFTRGYDGEPERNRRRRKTLPSDIDRSRLLVAGLLVLIPLVGLIVYFGRKA
jgi:hypothetical protein